MRGDLILLADLAEHLVLTGLPMAAAALLAARLGVRQVPVLLAVGLAASSTVAVLSFWAFYAERLAGEVLAYVVVLGSALLLLAVLRDGRLDRALLRQLAIPFLLWAAGSAFILFLGFLHGGIYTGLETAANRFSHPLPSDNALPGYFAEWFYANGHHGHPVFPPGWLASDRPPLQIGYVLSQRPFPPGGRKLDYQVLGVVLQQLWIIGLWALACAARLGRLTRGLAAIAALLSPLGIVNGFFVWPKLLPAAMLLAAAALMLTPLWASLRRSIWGAALVAALLALAMMGHGSSVFGVIPLVVVAAWRGLPSWRWIATGLLVAVAVMAPWSAYQRYGEPPGNRLLKWQLAGVAEVDPRGFVRTIEDSYRKAGIGGTLHNKAENLVTMVGGGPMVETGERAVSAARSGNLSESVEAIRGIFFFDLFPSIGLLLLAPLVMLATRRSAARRKAEWSFALACFLALLIGAAAWGLLIFGSEAARTVIHIGSYLLPLLGICGAVAGLRASLPRLGTWIVVLNAALMLALYVPSLHPPPGTRYSAVAALIAAASLIAFVLLVLRGDDVRPQSIPSQERGERGHMAVACRSRVGI